MKGQHTPGPWRVEDGCVVAPWSEPACVKHEDGSVGTTPSGLLAIVYSRGPSDEGWWDNAAANARLIAAAPEMYDVLTEWVRLVDGGPMGTASATEHLRRLHAAARTAIAKATDDFDDADSPEDDVERLRRLP